MKHQIKSGFTLAAIDLDGTLLGPDLTISTENLTAIRKLQVAGAEVVIASGRHYDSLRPFADLLPGVKWIVSAQGGEISDVQRSNVLHRVFLDRENFTATIELGETLGLTAVAYAVEGVFAGTTSTPDLEFYEWLAGRAPVILSKTDLLKKEVFKVVWLGQPEKISTLRDLASVQNLAMQKVQTHERIMELLPSDVSKATGLNILAKHLNVRPEDAVVFGDAENDISMFEWAGTSVAMPHAWPAAKAKATFTGPTGSKETALALAIDAALHQPGARWP